jgi:predicted ATPase
MALLLWTSSSQVGVGQVHHDFDWQRRGRGMVWQQRFVSSSPVSSAGVANGAACEAYTRLYESGKFQFDKNQFSLLKTLMKIEYNMHAILAEETKKAVTAANNTKKDDTDSTEGDGLEEFVQRRPRGLYVYGSVGTGKTVVMDLFFEHCLVPKKRRVHFHKFMLEVHSRIREEKQRMLVQHGRDIHINLLSERDAIKIVANKVADEANLLCFDEFQVLDICDAMILSKLFDTLWNRGTVLVATSNRPPTDLYKDGLNRHYFLPFIDSLQRNCIVRSMNSDLDYRMIDSHKMGQAFLHPINEATNKQLMENCLQMSQELAKIKNAEDNCIGDLQDVTVPVRMGRTITVRSFGGSSRVCITTFEHLCDSDRGAADYQALCVAFDCIFVAGVPELSSAKHNPARRFILLVDEIYDSRCLMRWSSETETIDTIFSDRGIEVSSEYAEVRAQSNDTVLKSKIDQALQRRDSRSFDVKENYKQGSSVLNGRLMLRCLMLMMQLFDDSVHQQQSQGSWS